MGAMMSRRGTPLIVGQQSAITNQQFQIFQ
jgi:hypothetical protein